jgi:microcin C transport system permease protein
MTRYLILRTLLIAPTILGVSLVTFVLIHAAPGGPFEVAVSRLQRDPLLSAQNQLSPKIIANLKNQYGFDKPIYERYCQWLLKILKLDLGESELYQAPVTEVVLPRLQRSAMYALWSLPLCYLLAFLWSLIHVVTQSAILRGISSFSSALQYCLPPLILALALKYVFVSSSFVLVIAGYVLSHLAMMVLLFRGSLMQQASAEYAKTARAKGLSEVQVIFRHTLRNAMIPIVTSLSYSVVAFFSGALFLEIVFEIDGLGMLSYKSALARDYNLTMGIVLVLSILFVLSRWVSDLAYGVIDPRMTNAS